MMIHRFILILLLLLKQIIAIQEFNLTILEEISIGSEIFDLSKEFSHKTQSQIIDIPLIIDDSDDEFYTQSSKFNNLTFTFLDSSKYSNEYFSINSTNFMLTIAKRIDRDTLCENKQIKSCTCHGICLFKLDFLATDFKNNNNFYNVFSILIHIIDINDNVPQFPRNEIIIEIPENVPIGHRIPIPNAFDADYGRNGINRYLLIPNNTNLFSIDYSNINSIFLRVDGLLDRELNKSYEYEILALDGGQYSLSGNASLMIKILDQNDNSPKFIKEYYRVNISESTLPGTNLLQVTAEDIDEGLNGQILYHLSTNDNNRGKFKRNKNETNDNGYFSIDKNTGEIYLIEHLDYEKQTSYKLIITASDRGIPSTFSINNCVVEVFVSDENDNAPEIRLVTAENQHRAYKSENYLKFKTERDRIRTLFVDESAPDGTFLALVSIDDVDSGDNGKFERFIRIRPNDGSIKEISLKDNKNLNMFKNTIQLNSGRGETFALVIAKSLDRETHSHYDIEIVAIDFGQPRLETKMRLKLVVNDKNDNIPHFSMKKYDFEINENNPLNIHIGCVQALDLDENENARIRYFLEGNTKMSNLLAINQSTGCLNALVSFDREIQEFYEFKVMAWDSGYPPLNSSTIVKLRIKDINDNVPYFSHGKYNFTLIEHTKVGSIIGHIQAHDLDKDENSKLEYTMHSMDNKANNYFVIDRETGELTVANDIDYDISEIPKEFNLIIYVTDKGIPSFGTSCIISIIIVNVNDNCPEIDVAYSKYLNFSLPSTTTSSPGVKFDSALFIVHKYMYSRLEIANFYLRDLDGDQVTIRNPIYKTADDDLIDSSLFNLTYDGHLMLNSPSINSGIYKIEFDLTDDAIKPCIVYNKYILVALTNNDTSIVEKGMNYMNKLVLTHKKSKDTNTHSKFQSLNGIFSPSNSILLIFCFATIVLVIILMIILCIYCSLKYKSQNIYSDQKSEYTYRKSSEDENIFKPENYSEKTKIISKSPINARGPSTMSYHDMYLTQTRIIKGLLDSPQSTFSNSSYTQNTNSSIVSINGLKSNKKMIQV